MKYKYMAKGTEKAVVFLGIGHGGKDSGAVGVLREETVNLKAGLYACDYLTSNGITVYMSRNKDENDPLTEEIREANSCNCACAVDLHANAGKGDGFEVFHSVNSSVTGGKLLAQYIEAEVKGLGQNSRGVKTRRNNSGSDYYGFIRQTRMSAVICEMCFVDNWNDAKDFDTDIELKAYGIAVAKGIIRWLEATGRIKNTGSSKPVSKPASNPTPSVRYYPRCKPNEDSLVDGLKYVGSASNFASRRNISKKNGIYPYTGTARQNVKLLELLKAGKLKK